MDVQLFLKVQRFARVGDDPAHTYGPAECENANSAVIVEYGYPTLERPCTFSQYNRTLVHGLVCLIVARKHVVAVLCGCGKAESVH